MSDVISLDTKRQQSMSHAITELERLMDRIKRGDVQQVIFAYSGKGMLGGMMGGIGDQRDQLMAIGLIESVKQEALAFVSASARRQDLEE